MLPWLNPRALVVHLSSSKHRKAVRLVLNHYFLSSLQDRCVLIMLHYSSLLESSQDSASLLRALLKFILHLMDTSGTSEGMRNLIDSSIISSVQHILKCKKIGANVFGLGELNIICWFILFKFILFFLAVNIMSTFIHNEPTSLSVLQENKLPDVFLEVVTQDFPISAEVISALPHAFGAICLNQQGLDSFKENMPIRKFLEIFTSDQHLRALIDNDVPHVVGRSVDELVRHHPTLKSDVLAAIEVMMKKVFNIGKAMVPSKRIVEDDGEEEVCMLLYEKISDKDVDMMDVADVSAGAQNSLRFTQYINVVSKVR